MKRLVVVMVAVTDTVTVTVNHLKCAETTVAFNIAVVSSL